MSSHRIITLLVTSPYEIQFHLDIGTNHGNSIRHIPSKKRLYCEVSKKQIIETPTPCFYGNALLLPEYFSHYSFDLVTAFDVIEHQTKENGYKMIEMVEKMTCGRIVFGTPYGEVGVGVDLNEHQTHLSGWWPVNFTRCGYKCVVYPHFHPHCGYFFAVKDVRYNYKFPEIPLDSGIFKGGYICVE